MTVACRAEPLRALPLFSLLSEPELAAIEPHIEFRNYARGAEIVKSGEKAEGVYLLLAGTVDVLLEDTSGHRVIVHTLVANETFNEAALFIQGASRVTYAAAKASQVLHVPREALAAALDQNGKLAAFLSTALARRLDQACQKLAVFGLDDVYTRVIDVILSHGFEQHGAWHVNVGAGTMAEMVGASREMVSRVTKDLVKRGLVTREKRKIVVADCAPLKKWAEHRLHKERRRETATLQMRPIRTATVEIAAP